MSNMQYLRFLVQRSSRPNHVTMRGFASRDAPLPPLSNPVEQAIGQARAQGKFNGLAGAGKPLPKNKETSPIAGITTSELLSKRAEFSMRRAIHNKELEHLAGQKLVYKGTNIVSTSLSGSSSDGMTGKGSGADVMGDYILKQAQPSAAHIKNMTKTKQK